MPKIRIKAKTPMDEIVEIETSTQLYRLISRENLHLRSGHGRDDVLIKQLAKKLDLDPSKQIPKQLESKKISLEKFIQAFFLLTEPFTRMISNIYAVMQRHKARLASRSIRMKFSFQKISEELDFDLAHFREWQAVYRRLYGRFTVRLWTPKDIAKLFQPIRTLLEIYGGDHIWEKNRRYSSPLPEPQILITNSRWTPLRELRDAMEQLRQIASEETDDARSKALSVLTKEDEEEQIFESDSSKARSILSDLWSGFLGLLSQLEQHPPRKHMTTKAQNALREIDQILHEVRRTNMDGELVVRDLIELLRLPFWKYRWRVYEVWIMFEVVDCLDEYNATLELVRDKLALKEYKASKVAQFEDFKSMTYEIWAQLETSVISPYKRRHIMPDLRLCRSDAKVPENSFLIIECKQRKSMKSKEIEDLIEDYRRGANKSVLNLFVNYDEFPSISSIFPKAKLLSNVSPANPQIVQEFKNLIKKTLIKYGIEPAVLQYDAILFDISGSMRGRYPAFEVSKACKDLLIRNPHSTVFFFGSDLLATEMLPTEDLVKELENMISGSTNLEGALRELHKKHHNIKRVAVVTDGRYDGPITSRSLYELVEELILEKNFARAL